MDQKAIEADVKNYKIREGPLYKRSKFLKEWRERWIVLTTNYLYTFTSKNLDEVTDVLDLKQFKSYKSYLRKDQEMIPPGFKIRTADDMYYFCAKNCNEKWSWLVTLERLMDYKYVGTSNYNNADWIKTKGFESQVEFENGKSKSGPSSVPELEKQKTSEEAKKEVNDEADSILKQLEQQQKELEKMKLQLAQKEASLEKKQASFVLEQKKIEEQKAKLQQQPPAKQPQPEKPKEKPEQQSPVKHEAEKTKGDHQPSVSELRSIYESKKSEGGSQSKPMPKLETTKTQKKEDDIHLHRSKVVNSLFEEFKSEYSFSNILKYVTEFLVNVGADQKCGYSSFVVIEGKTNQNKNNFAEVFTEFLSGFEDYENCENLMKFFEICIFQMPGVFSHEQIGKAQIKLKQMLNKVNNEEKLALVLKNMFIMQKLKKYNKNDISGRLDKIVKEAKNQQARNWAQKLRDDLDK